MIGAVLLLPWTLARGQLRPALRHWKPLLLFTVLEMTGPWLLLSWAEQSLSSSLTGLLVAGVPFVAALAARLAGEDERLTPVRVARHAARRGRHRRAARPRRGGAPAAADRRRRARRDRLRDRAAGGHAGRCPTSPAWPRAPRAGGHRGGLRAVRGAAAGPVGEASATALLSLVVLGVVCTALALALFFALIREVGPQRALVITFLNPAVAVLLGVLLLDEPFTLGLALGLPLVLLGCVLATRRSPVRTERSELCEVDSAVP